MDDKMEECFDRYEDPKSPRIGYEYQVNLPPLMTKHDHLQLIKAPVCAETVIDVTNHLGIGLSVPVTWVHNNVEKINAEGTDIYAKPVESENTKEVSQSKVGSLYPALNDVEDLGCISSFERIVGNKRLIPLPGVLSEAWNDIEHDSFLLALYIFGKNLRLVKKMVGSKGMGCILSHYYGKFYRSPEYKRWSDCRKSRTRRSIHGERIFTGSRQQKILSRLFPKVTEECKNSLTEMCRLFGEGKLSLEEYIFTLKDIVGIDLLVEVVAIGKGKQDLTGMSTEPLKTNNNSSGVRYEVPVGKACSSLTSSQIVKFLTGDVRLSKARSNDLFWEAVWPRLLARGWHSEQPRCYVSHGSKISLVFLIPGVKKFSRRKLSKGIDYFDSPTDLLRKVASEPELLELKTESAREDETDPKIERQGSDGFASKQRHCYLQAPATRDHMKFTVVDTSTVGRVKVTELRNLPSISRATEQGTAEESQSEPEDNRSTSKSNHQQDATGNRSLVDHKDQKAIATSDGTAEESQSEPEDNRSTSKSNHQQDATGNRSFVDHKDQKASATSDGPFRFKTKFKLSLKMKSCHSNDTVTPRSSKDQPTTSGDGESRNKVDSCKPETDQNPALANSLAYTGMEHRELSLNDKYNGSEGEPPLEKEQVRNMIDLNVPQSPLDLERAEPVVPEAEASKDQVELMNPTNGGVGQRQKSMRNRPLTTKALEALACGYLSPKRKRKSTDGVPHNEPSSKPPWHGGAKASLVTSCGGSAGVGKQAALYNMEKGVEGK